MDTKRTLANKICDILETPQELRERTVLVYALGLTVAELQEQVAELPAIVARLKAEGQWNGVAPVATEECTLCGEGADAEMGEFWDKAKDISVYAHAQCGLDAGLPLA